MERKNMKRENERNIQSKGVAQVVKGLLTTDMSVEEQMEGLKQYPPAELSTRDLAECVDVVVLTATSRINTRQYGRPVVIPAGTGGDGKSTANITTMAGVVMAASGEVTVPLYGNRSASGRVGKMDVLEELGIDINLPPEEVERRLKEDNVAAISARNIYPGAGRVALARKNIGQPTVFNSVMPLALPIEGERRALLGIADPTKLSSFAEVTQARGTTRSVLVHNRRDRMDELSFGDNDIEVVQGNSCSKTQVNSADVGIRQRPVEILQVTSAAEAAKLFEAVLDPAVTGSQVEAVRDVVALNAAAGLYAAGNGQRSINEELPGLFRRARGLIENGDAQRTLRRMQRRT